MSIRNKYKQQQQPQTSLTDTIKGVEEEISTGNGGGLVWLQVEEGFNDFRFFPSTVDGVSFIQLRHTHRLPIEIEKEDGTKEIVDRKPVYNSRTHGGTPKDVIDEYIKFYENIVKEELSVLNLSDKDYKAQLKNKMACINDWKKGIKPEFKWTGYAGKLDWGTGGKLNGVKKGIFDFAFSVGKKMDALAAAQDRRGIVTTTNPFVDIDTGAILVIDYDKKRDPAEMYRVSIDNQVQHPWTDEDLDWLEAQRSLAEQYVGSYRRKDFNMAIEGLQRFDQRNRLGVFQHPQFITIVQEISNYYPQDENQPMIVRETAQQAHDNRDPFGSEMNPNQPTTTGAAQVTQPVTTQPVVGANNTVQAPIVQQAPVVEEQPEMTRRQPLRAVASHVAGNAQTATPVTEPVRTTSTSTQQLSIDQMTRDQLLGYIQLNKLQIHVTSDFTDAQIRQFIQQEEALNQVQTPNPETPVANNAVNAQDIINQPQQGGDIAGQMKNLF